MENKMNAKQARQVPITLILEKMGLKPIREKNNEAWYKSPFRNEKTESFHVHIHKNVWFDFGEGKGGNVVDLVCKYLEATGYDHQVPDALRWIKNMTVSYVPDKTLIQPTENKESKLSVKRVFSLKHVALIHYLEKRGIPESLARKYTKEVHAHNKETGKGFLRLVLKTILTDGNFAIKGTKAPSQRKQLPS
ncbi:MAG: CHC2 zinc finger domain-containing protein [Bacteroidota bacterium]